MQKFRFFRKETTIPSFRVDHPNPFGPSEHEEHEFEQPPVCPLVHDVVVPELQPLTPGALAASPHWAHARLPLKGQHTIEQHRQLPPRNQKFKGRHDKLNGRPHTLLKATKERWIQVMPPPEAPACVASCRTYLKDLIREEQQIDKLSTYPGVES